MRDRLQSRISPDQNEQAFVLVFAAIAFTVLFGIAGFAVDVGNWYLQIDTAQRQADSAALAGAIYLPGDPAAADAAASATLRANGFDPALASYIGPDPDHDDRMKVKLPGSVKSIFVGLIGVNDFHYSRQGVAYWSQPIAMGSPDNVLGEEPSGSGSWSSGAHVNQYWLSQNTAGRPKEYADRWDPINCNGTDFCSGGTNLEYEPGGRSFDVNVASGVSGWLAIEAYDPGISASGCAGTCPGDHVTGGAPDTTFSVWTPPQPGDPSHIIRSGVGCNPRSYPTNDPATMGQWTRVCSLFIDGSTWIAGNYKITVNIGSPASADGINSYSLRAAILSTPTGPINTAQSQLVTLHASDKMVTRHAPATVSDVYIAKLPSSLAGTILHVQLYDYGEGGADYLRLTLNGTGEPYGCSAQIASIGLSLNSDDGACKFNTTSNYTQFASRVLDISVPIAKSYSCVAVTQDSCWLKLQTSYTATGAATVEGSSISVFRPGAPLRLTNPGG